MSDSNYLAVTRLRTPFATHSTGRPRVVLEAMMLSGSVEGSPEHLHFASMDTLSDDEIDTARHEVPLMGDDEDLEPDAAVVSTGTSASAATSAEQRQRREEGWNDLALDQIDDRRQMTGDSSTAASENGASNGTPQSGGNQGGNGSN